MVYSKKRAIYSLVVFVAIFCFMGLPFKKMGFDSDAFGKVFSVSNEDVSWDVFKESIPSKYCPLNEPKSKATYLSLYRPLQGVTFFLCFSLFGTEAYYYYLFSIFLHAFVSVILYLIFSLFFTEYFAFLLTLLFAFHPAHIPSFIGLICAVIPVFFFLAPSVLLLILFLRGERRLYYYVSGFLYFLSLLSYETAIALPAVLMLYLLLFDRKEIISKLWLPLVVSVLYCLIRLVLLGTGIHVERGMFSLKSLIFKVIENIHQAIKPFFGLQQSSTILALIVLGLLSLFICFYLWLNKPGRKLMLFYILSFFVAAWPIFVANGSSRYFYTAIPFFCLIIFELLSYFSSYFSFISRKTFISTGLLFLVGFGMVHAFKHLRRREQYTFRRDLAFKDIAKKYANIVDVKLIYIGTLQYYNAEIFLLMSGLTQASRLFFKNPDLLAYHVTEAKVYSKYPTQKTMQIETVIGGYRFISPDPENLFIMCPNAWREGNAIDFSMGKIVVNKKISSWQATDVTFIFDDKWLKESELRKTKFLTWDVGAWKFVELAKNHLLRASTS